MKRVIAYKRAGSESGFSMVEILIALFILSIGFIGVLSLFPVGLDATKRMVQDSTSSGLAKTAYAHAMSVAEANASTWRTSGARLTDSQETGSVGSVPASGDQMPVSVDAIGPNAGGQWEEALMVITSGKAEGKIYRVKFDGQIVKRQISNTDFHKDEIRQGDSYKLIRTSSFPMVMDTPITSSTAPLPDPQPADADPGNSYSYGYVIGPLGEGLASLDIFVYRNFDTSRGYEGNDPPVRWYSTVIALSDPDGAYVGGGPYPGPRPGPN